MSGLQIQPLNQVEARLTFHGGQQALLSLFLTKLLSRPCSRSCSVFRNPWRKFCFDTLIRAAVSNQPRLHCGDGGWTQSSASSPWGGGDLWGWDVWFLKAVQWGLSGDSGWASCCHPLGNYWWPSWDETKAGGMAPWIGGTCHSPRRTLSAHPSVSMQAQVAGDWHATQYVCCRM